MSQIVPAQKKGVSSNTHYSVRTGDEKSAAQLFRQARLNLLNVNGWHSLAGAGAQFQLVNEEGQAVNRLAEKGNYFRINIPGVPGTDSGEGAEWVIVEKIEEEKLGKGECISMRVRPAKPPFSNTNETAHFFTEEATSTFRVWRKGNKVIASVMGRNEKPNTHTKNFFTLIRNAIVGLAAMIGFNKPQWKSLVKGILQTNGRAMYVV